MKTCNEMGALEERGERARVEVTIRICRNRVRFPVCDIEYVEVSALLAHLRTSEIPTTSVTQICAILQQNIPIPGLGASRGWEMTQEHDTEGREGKQGKAIRRDARG